MITRNSLYTVLFFLLFSLPSFGQNREVWEKLLNNEREEALELSNSLSSNEVGDFILSEIVRSENGLFTRSDNFVQQLMKSEDKEPYIYALWNERFLFNTYLHSGIDGQTAANIDLLYEQEYANSTLSDALKYLKAVKEREFYNFGEYKEIVSKIPAIRNWQMCGVFENLNNSALNKEYGPEISAKSIGGFNANSNGIVDWYTPEISTDHVYSFFENHREYGSGVHYLQTFFSMPEEKRITVNIGASGKFKLWLDDIVIYENDENLSTDMDAYSVEVTIPKGTHRLLFKLASATSGGYSIVRFKELDGSPITNIEFNSEYTDYNKLTLKQLNLKELSHPYEVFFEEKLKNDPNNFLYTYCLVKMYMRNERYKKAKKILIPLKEKYPKSSIIRSMLINVYSVEGDYSKVEKLQENMQIDDEFYFGSMTYKFQDVGGLMRMSMENMSAFLDTYSASTDMRLVHISTDLIKTFRLENKAESRRLLDELMDIAITSGNVDLIKIYSGLYQSVLNDKNRMIKQLEKLNKKRFDMGVQRTLIMNYNTIGRYDKVIKVLKQNVENMENDIDIYRELINYLHYIKRYEEARPYIDKALRIFPYSFIIMEMKGDNAIQSGNVDEAVENYKRSLVHNSGNSDLRRMVRDISGAPDIIETVRNKEVYDLIATRRNKITENNYGFNTLLYDAIIELYEEAGGRARYSIVYEVTSELGVESIKEYDLNLYSNYSIITSEIVKPNGSVIPADRSGSQLVFENLEVGDVVNIDYEVGFNGNGRFYKDYVDSYNFDSYHPRSQVRYVLFVPKSMEFAFETTSGDIPFKKETLETHDKYIWEVEENKSLAEAEDYMPEKCDVSRVLHISTIDNWNEIATWYSDLVRSQLIINSEVQSAFESCFEGKEIETMSDEEKARTIYDFMMARLTYSFVSFRQSGFVPQKPSRTLATNLGDCKDLSSLFVLFSKMANLKSNLVLVLTSDYGENEIVLPSTDFNHCIVKVIIDGEAQYLELTNNHLPFKSLPNSLLDARVLEIPFTEDDMSKTYDLESLVSPSRIKNKITIQVDLVVEGDHKVYTVENEVSGAAKSYQSEVLENPNMDIVKEEMADLFDGSIEGNVKIDSVYHIENDRAQNYTRFTCAFSQTEKVQKIGSVKVLKIPSIVNAYTDDIVREEKRVYPINYKSYETIDEYKTVYNIYLKEGERFIELPENEHYSFKGHTYTRTYEKVTENCLRISVEAHTDLSNISPEDYAAFKEYVLNVLEAKNQFVGYK